MKPTEDQIKEIAELLDCGELCFWHRPTGTLEHHPNPDSPYFDPEPWQETLDKIESDWDNYIRFDPMDSLQSFQVMEGFANSLSDNSFRTRLLKLLAQHKPFRKFKEAVDDSNHRQNWFDFKEQGYINWVHEQLARL